MTGEPGSSRAERPDQGKSENRQPACFRGTQPRDGDVSAWRASVASRIRHSNGWQMRLAGMGPTVTEIARLSLRMAQRDGRAPSTMTSKEEQWRLRIVPTFVGRTACSVAYEEAEDAARGWAAEDGGFAAQKSVKEAAHGWRMAIRRGWLTRSPWAGIDVSPPRRPQRRMLRVDRELFRSYLEPVALRGASSRFDRVTACALLSLAETPMGRVAEVAALPKSGVDYRRRLITWREHKTARQTGPKVGTLSAYQAEVFRVSSALDGGSPWVFARRSTGSGHVHELCKSMARVCRHIGLPRHSPHDLRRGIAQDALDSGASLEEIQALLGHESRAQTERYLGWSPVLAKAAQRLVTLGGGS